MFFRKPKLSSKLGDISIMTTQNKKKRKEEENEEIAKLVPS